MKLQALELIHVAMPLVSPFRTSFGTETVREALLLRLATDGPDGWGECVAGTEPLYSSEFLVASAAVITKHLWPRLVAYERGHGPVAPAHVAQALAPVKGHPMAKAAVEMAVLDAYELLRQLIDATDDLVGMLVVAVIPPDLVSDEKRGLPSYAALQLRVADEVRDRRRTNPFASLVRLDVRLEAVR